MGTVRWLTAQRGYGFITREHGKVHLEPYRTSGSDGSPFFITNLLTSDDPLSKNYRENIRSFNCALAMASANASIDRPDLRGPYYFKIHGQFYHLSPAFAPANGDSPSYGQIYMFDVETAARQRMGHVANTECNPEVMRLLGSYLATVNPFALTFKSMHQQRAARPAADTEDVFMFMVTNERQDKRRYNQPTAGDIAAVFRSSDGAPPNPHFLVVPSRGAPVRLSFCHPFLDPLCYPALFPFGDLGWNTDMRHQTVSSTTARTKITMREYASYRLMHRAEFSILQHSGPLYLQWIVDMYTRVEGQNLNYIRFNQSKLRADSYAHLTDDVLAPPLNGQQRIEPGKQVILPSSFHDSPRLMHERYQDAMAIVRTFGKPDLFITMTCNPKWPEIVDNLLPGQHAHENPALVSRVFRLKYRSLIKELWKGQVFGRPTAKVATIEFQKRGLPHVHIPLSQSEEDKIREPEQVDRIVSAEIPDPTVDPELYEQVKAHMIHGPCGTFNQNSPCMSNGHCKKKFPKPFASETRDCNSGFPIYKRRSNGVEIDLGRGKIVGNGFIVPYNRYLLLRYQCHINVEVCATVQDVKYLYKYITKGHDAASVIISKSSSENAQDEIQSYLNGRYVGSPEAAWRLFAFETHDKSHVVERLHCHLPGQQNVLFTPGNKAAAAAKGAETKLTAWFTLNQEVEAARQYKYAEIPQHFVWNNRTKKWTPRQRGGDKIITRIYTVHPKKGEQFFLRSLILHLPGAMGYEDLRTVDGIIYPTFKAACVARGLILSDEQWRLALAEAASTEMPSKIRKLFAFICAMNSPADVPSLWNEFQDAMSEDFKRTMAAGQAYNRALFEIEEILITHNTSCSALGLPVPRAPEMTLGESDNIDHSRLAEELYAGATAEQRIIIDDVVISVASNTPRMIFIDAPAGCGKTYTQRAIMHSMHAQSVSVLPVAFTGIAASLLPRGRTMHNAFKLPFNMTETDTPDVKKDSAHAAFLRNVRVIVLDEVSQISRVMFGMVDRLLRDIEIDPNKKDAPFGGKVVLMSGDFRQILPVVAHGGHAETVSECIKSSPLWQQVTKYTLSRNMRVNAGQDNFAQFLLSVGSGSVGTLPEGGNGNVMLPPSLAGQGSPVDYIYSTQDLALNADISERAILAPTNADCAKLNLAVVDRLPGEAQEYLSIDTEIFEDGSNTVRYPTEFLNTIEVSGLPAHKLVLKKAAIVMLMRNMNTPMGLINGPRMRVEQMGRGWVDCQVLTGAAMGERVLIPRIPLDPSTNLIPVKFTRLQFPLTLAFAMTINKSQGKTISKIAIFLRTPVFAHGQLYVGLSRSPSEGTVRVFIEQGPEQATNQDGSVSTKNVVYREIL